MTMQSPRASDAHSPPVLPRTLRLLCVGAEEPSWVSLTMQLSARGCDEPLFRWSSTGHEALTILRHQIFDCILVATRSNLAREIDLRQAEQLVEAIRSSGHDEPLLVLTDALDDETWERFANADCQIVITDRTWDAPSLVPLVTRAVRTLELSREHAQLKNSQQRRQTQERTETEQLLLQQRRILRDAKSHMPTAKTSLSPGVVRSVSDEMRRYYQQLLRTSVMMGDGSLTAEIRLFAQLLLEEGLGAREAFGLHLDEVDRLTTGLGHRSARHAVSRADLLVLELLVILSDGTPRNGSER